ncbi:unnamed protein product [Cuscuta campestris]|uniref:Tf2-1-like SH3-like domain-containing protein n=1 Tax=Cuscuta campestris TaxID=132261 RepID=A0A484LRV7_9ASTE|nr:unnamed protein product [Cuscuta campestris]
MSFFKVSPWKKVLRFGKIGKLSPRFIGPYPITTKVGPVAYQLELLPELNKIHNGFHVSMLRRYRSDPTHQLPKGAVTLDENLTYEEELVQILAREVKELRNKRVPLVKVFQQQRRRAPLTPPSPNALAGVAVLPSPSHGRFGRNRECSGELLSFDLVPNSSIIRDWIGIVLGAVFRRFDGGCPVVATAGVRAVSGGSDLDPTGLILTDDEIQSHILCDLEDLLRSRGKSLRDYPNMPQANLQRIWTSANRLIFDEMQYDRIALTIEHTRLLRSLNDEQRLAKWIESIGDGNAGDEHDGYAEVIIPDDMLLPSSEDPIATIVNSTYPDFQKIANELSYLQERAILALSVTPQPA